MDYTTKPSYYYMSSTSVTTYNDRGKKVVKQKVVTNHNGIPDSYYKKSVVENNNEKIVAEKGNNKLAVPADSQLVLDNRRMIADFRRRWQRLFTPFMQLFNDPWLLLDHDIDADEKQETLESPKTPENIATNVVPDSSESVKIPDVDNATQPENTDVNVVNDKKIN